MGFPDKALLAKLRERGERQESFTFTHEGVNYRWDVSAAWRIIVAYPREPELFRPSEQGVDIHHLMDRYRDLDINHAMTTDPSIPLLFVPFQGRHQLVDGWHRLAKALIEEDRLGSTELTAFLLTQEESDVVLLSVRKQEGVRG